MSRTPYKMIELPSPWFSGTGADWIADNDKALADAVGQVYVRDRAPTETDDSAHDYVVGDRWIDTVEELIYWCIDATAGAAKWRGPGLGAKGDTGPQGSTAVVNWRGPYDTQATYSKDDGVHYGGSSYVSLVDDNVSVPADNSYWMLLAERGQEGPQSEIPGPQGAAGDPGGPRGYTPYLSVADGYLYAQLKDENGQNVGEPVQLSPHYEGTVGEQGAPGEPIVMNFVGAYSGSTSYAQWDVVTYSDNNTYVAIDTPPQGTVPTNATYWRVLALGGSQGETGSQGQAGSPGTPIEFQFKGTYSGATEYTTWDVVYYQGSTYISIATGNTGHLPPNETYWQILASGSQGVPGETGPAPELVLRGTYSAGTEYSQFDLVDYVVDGKTNSYICKQTSTGNAPTNTTYWQILASGGVQGATGVGLQGPPGEYGGPRGFTPILSESNGDLYYTLYDQNNQAQGSAVELCALPVGDRGYTPVLTSDGTYLAYTLYDQNNQPQGSQVSLGAMPQGGPTGAQGSPGADSTVPGPQGEPGANAITWAGNWGAQSYGAMTACTYEGSTYLTVAGTVSQNVPPENSDFVVLAEKGADGAAGEQGAAGAQAELPFTFPESPVEGSQYRIDYTANGWELVCTYEPEPPEVLLTYECSGTNAVPSAGEITNNEDYPETGDRGYNISTTNSSSEDVSTLLAAIGQGDTIAIGTLCTITVASITANSGYYLIVADDPNDYAACTTSTNYQLTVTPA